MKPLRTFCAAFLIAAPAAAALAAGDIVVHRDPGCGCCAKWAARLGEATGRAVSMVDDQKRRDFRKKAGIPEALSSCHTAVIDGLVFEGHVPVKEVERLLTQRPKGVVGLAVAGMPIGSPGMEVPGMKPQPYQVMAFGPGGQRVFASY